MRLNALERLYMNIDQLRDTKGKVFVDVPNVLFVSEIQMMDMLIKQWGWEEIDRYTSPLLNPDECGLLLPCEGKINLFTMEEFSLTTGCILQIFISLNNALVLADMGVSPTVSLLEAKDFMAKAIGFGLNFKGSTAGQAIANEINKKEKIASLCRKGGQSHYDDKEPFITLYRAEREKNPTVPRIKLVEKIKRIRGFRCEPSTLNIWSKNADKEDGFIRKAGRPKKW